MEVKKSGLSRRISRTFLLQAAAISVATILGILLAGYILEEVLIKEALKRESEYFWNKHEVDPSFPLPDTHNLSAYLIRENKEETLPEILLGLESGFHHGTPLPEYYFVFVSIQEGHRLYLIFDNEQVGKLSVWFGIIPLMLVLLVLYLSVWLSFKISQRAVSPIISLADRVNKLDPESPDAKSLKNNEEERGDHEVIILSNALAEFVERIQLFLERESNFTRDASHELRTPLSVILVASEMILDREEVDPSISKDVLRIKRAATEMNELVEAFLLLARESDNHLHIDKVSINDVVRSSLESLSPFYLEKSIDVESNADCELMVNAPKKTLSIIVDNLLRNAINYTNEGSVLVHIGSHQISIRDSGIGMDLEEADRAFELYFRGSSKHSGHGIGLSIVKRLADRFGWSISLSSTPGKGTTVIVDFPNASSQPIKE